MFIGQRFTGQTPAFFFPVSLSLSLSRSSCSPLCPHPQLPRRRFVVVVAYYSSRRLSSPTSSTVRSRRYTAGGDAPHIIRARARAHYLSHTHRDGFNMIVSVCPRAGLPRRRHKESRAREFLSRRRGENKHRRYDCRARVHADGRNPSVVVSVRIFNRTSAAVGLQFGTQADSPISKKSPKIAVVPGKTPAVASGPVRYLIAGLSVRGRNRYCIYRNKYRSYFVYTTRR